VATALDLSEGVQGLVGYAASDLDALWREITGGADAAEALNDVLPGLVSVYGSAASALAADWYDEVRAEVSPRSRFTAVPADIADVGAYSLIGWAVDAAVDDASLRMLIEGGMQRRIANFSRLTVTGSAVSDPAAVGWQRVGNGGCTSGFCDMLISRGAVYSEATASFAAHDNCKCSAVPAWGGRPVPVKPYKPSLRHVSDADRQRVREWVSVNL
jgi:hypothetical protein